MNLLMDLINHLTGYGPGAIIDGDQFWSSWIGLFISFSIFICSAVNILHPGIDDGLLDRLYFVCAGVVAFIAFITGLDPHTQNPHNISKTLLLLMAFRLWWKVIYRVGFCAIMKQSIKATTPFKHSVKGQKKHVKTR